jgi:hypothetical protein
MPTISTLAAQTEERQTLLFGTERPAPIPPAKTTTPRLNGRIHSVPASQPVEPEDAYLTGVSRSLHRRLLGLNMERARELAKTGTDGR